MRLIVGLGNPGPEYEDHRHNIGFRVVARLGERLRVERFQAKFGARIAQASLSRDTPLLLLQPQSFMNLSGEPVSQAARFFKIAAADTLVVHDELDLPFGKLQLKAGGGTGGHNGLRSIVERTGEEGFVRLRFGIGKPEGPNAKARVSGYVLSGFFPEEARALPELLDRAVDMIDCWAQEGLQVAMNRYNRR